MVWSRITAQIFSRWKTAAVATLALTISLIVIGFSFSATALFENKNASSILVQDSGLTCEVPIVKPWKSFVQIFGFSSIMYQESPKDLEKRAMLGFVISKFDGVELGAGDIEKEFKAFQDAKAEYVREEGGVFIGAAESLKGQNGIYRIAVKYRLEGEDLKDSSYFFLVNNRLFHAKALFAYKDFDETILEREILTTLAGIKCTRD